MLHLVKSGANCYMMLRITLPLTYISYDSDVGCGDHKSDSSHRRRPSNM